mgnify:CR=1 FL=1
MNDYWTWWIAAALLVGAELLTGTYYLLAVGLALGIGGLAAWLGAAAPAQFAVAAVAGVVATAAAHQWRIRRALPPPQAGLDVGQPVQVENWNADGTDDIAVWRTGKFYQDSNGNRAWNSATDTLTTGRRP